MTILEIVLIAVIVVLIIVLVIETTEYKKTREFTQRLEGAINAYSAGYNALASAVQVIEKAFEQTADEHVSMAEELIRLNAILEIHNRALILSPQLMKKTDEENRIP